MPLITALSDAPQQIMVHTSNHRYTGTLGFRGGNFLIRPNFCATLRKTNGLQALVLLKKLAQTYRQVFPEFFKSCPNLPTTSYYSSNAETLAKY